MPGTPLCLLLLPCALGDFARADEARDLLRAPGVVAVEPARLTRVPDLLTDLLAAIQARRVVRQVPGTPRLVVVFDEQQHAQRRHGHVASVRRAYAPPGC